MSAGDHLSTHETITYRGRSLEEVLPRIREELGPDAIIERQRSGLVGGVGGFFQREMIEVDARPGEGGPPPRGGAVDVLAGAEDDAALRAVAGPLPDPDRDEGLGAPVMRRIVEQSEPFADLLHDAESALLPGGGEPRPGDTGTWDAWSEDLADEDEEPEPAVREAAPPYAPPVPPAGPYAASAYRQSAGPGDLASPFGAPAPEPPRFAPSPPPAPETVAEAPAARPAGAEAPLRALAERGLPPELAATVVDEAVVHVLPFAPARTSVKKVVRTALARRIPVQGGVGGAGRTVALVGTAGAGKTRATAGLAAAYAAAGALPVVCLTLRPADVGAELAELLDPHGVTVRPVEDGAAARAHIGARAGRAIVLLDTPAVSPRDAQGVARLAGDLRAAGVTETHVVLPATLAGPVAAAAVQAFAPLDPAALLLTHADETDHLGPLVALAMEGGRPLSYVTAGPAVGADLVPADPGALAARLLP